MTDYQSKFTGEEIDERLEKAGVQADYEQTDSSQPDFIKNKPFGEIKVFDDIVWDGNTEGLLSVGIDKHDTDHWYYYKVSDKVLSKNDLIGSFADIVLEPDTDSEYSSSISLDTYGYADVNSNGSFVTSFGDIAFISQDNTIADLSDVAYFRTTLVFPEAGVWFFMRHQTLVDYKVRQYTADLIARTNIIQIDEKFIPDSIARTSDVATLDDEGKIPTSLLPEDIGGGVASWNDLQDKPFCEDKAFSDIVWDGNIEGLSVVSGEVDMGGGTILTVNCCKVSDNVITKEQILGSNVTYYIQGEKDWFTIEDVFGTGSGSFVSAIQPVLWVCANDGDTIEFQGMVTLTFPEKGVWFTLGTIGDFTLIQSESLTTTGTIKQLDKKFIPDALPTVTANDNGKFLLVDNGVWVAKALSEWSGGNY